MTSSLLTLWRSYRLIIILAVITLGAAFAIASYTSSESVEAPENTASTTPPAVTVGTPQEFTDPTTLTVLGTVETATDARITTQTGGRVSSVLVREGDRVNAGATLFTLENANQRAAVRQAEASLQAAEASAAESGISVTEAERTLRTARQDTARAVAQAYTTAEEIILNRVDQFYSNPRQGLIGARVGSGSVVSTMNEERVAFRDILPAWSALSQTPAAEMDYRAAMDTSTDHLERLRSLLDTLRTAVTNESPNSRYSAATLQELESTLLQSRSQILEVEQALQQSERALARAEDGLASATVRGGATPGSGATAEINRATAALESAQIALDQTIIRSPISGVLNEFTVTLGDYVSPGTELGSIADNADVEVVTNVNPQAAAGLAVGDTVTIADTETGTISEIASALERASGQLQITVRAPDANLTVNDRVRVTFRTAETERTTTVQVPITALQFRGTDASVLTVDSENVLQAQPVELGTTRNNQVEVLDGITNSTVIVQDARGKRAGEVVESVPINR